MLDNPNLGVHRRAAPREFRQEYECHFIGEQLTFDDLDNAGEQPRPLRLVVIESPFGHPIKVGMEDNAAYGRKCMLDSLRRGEAPYASHLLYTQCLDDLKTQERRQGMEAGFAWGAIANHVAVYTDRGISRGMLEGIRRHHRNGLTIEFRSINNVA